MMRLVSAAIAVLLLMSLPVAADETGPVVRVVSPPFTAGDEVVLSVGPAAKAVLSGCVDGDPGTAPAKWRYRLVPARTVGFDDPDWSEWTEWPATGSPVMDLSGLASVDDQPGPWLLAVQAEAADGRRSRDLAEIYQFG